MVAWIGFAYAALAAVGHSGIDATRKLASQELSPAELVALVGVLDAVYLTTIVLGLNLTPGFKFVTVPLVKILVLSSLVKILAGVMYQRALGVSPLSVTVPYLAFVPALILGTGFFLLHEVPSLQGMAGVCVVTLGGYLLALNSSKPVTGKGGKGSTQPLTAKDSGSSPKPADSRRQAEVDKEMGFGSDLVSVGLSTGSQRPFPKSGSSSNALAGGVIGVGQSSKAGKTPPFRSRPATAFSSDTSSAAAADASSAWDFTQFSRGRFGLGHGIGLNRGKEGAIDEEIAEAVGDTALSTTSSSLDLRPAKSASIPAARKDMDSDGDDCKGSPLVAGMPLRPHALSAAAYARSTYSRLVDRLRAMGVEEGTMLMLFCAVCLSLTNGFDKMGIHNSPSVLVFAWLQRLFMGLPPAAYLFLVSPGSFTHLPRHFVILSAVSFFEILAIVFYLKSVEYLLVSYAVACKRINILASVLVGHFVFKENIWRRMPYILLMMSGMLLVIFAPT